MVGLKNLIPEHAKGVFLSLSFLAFKFETVH